MSRLIAADRVAENELRPYEHADVSSGSPSDGEAAAWPEPDGGPAVQFEFLDSAEIAPYLLLLAAEDRAREIVARAESDAERLRTQAWEEAAAKGREEGRRELLPSLIAFGDAAQALIVFEERLIARYAPQMVHLALEIAEKIIGKTATEDPGLVASVLERAKREVAEAKQIRIWLNPADYEVLSETRPDLVRFGDGTSRTIEVVASEDISRGGCRLETELGIVDATLPTQIAEVRRQLLDDTLPDAASHP
ncbi:MAG TPA: FliH/SctL family protein [candidate division Zixibacteria bacterium]|nr:FliH/SctL family protein [candidate division Zixibacteria bacterium]